MRPRNVDDRLRPVLPRPSLTSPGSRSVSLAGMGMGSWEGESRTVAHVTGEMRFLKDVMEKEWAPDFRRSSTCPSTIPNGDFSLTALPRTMVTSTVARTVQSSWGSVRPEDTPQDDRPASIFIPAPCMRGRAHCVMLATATLPASGGDSSSLPGAPCADRRAILILKGKVVGCRAHSCR
jgi:hypothetical protein